jgi:hypothetical protein
MWTKEGVCADNIIFDWLVNEMDSTVSFSILSIGPKSDRSTHSRSSSMSPAIEAKEVQFGHIAIDLSSGPIFPSILL